MTYSYSSLYTLYIKRILDFFLSFIGLTLLSPLLIILIVILFYVNKGKPFFTQKRPGKDGKLFQIIKFKTMRDLDPLIDLDVHSPKRITKAGEFIRKYSLDELLQLVNVFKGDMSVVGPRPLLIEYLPLYNEKQRKRHDLRPGITGWAQINGRNALSWNEKFKFDIWYVEHVSFFLDIMIIYRTVLKVYQKEGINQGEETIMPVWRGN